MGAGVPDLGRKALECPLRSRREVRWTGEKANLINLASWEFLRKNLESLAVHVLLVPEDVAAQLSNDLSNCQLI